MSSSDDESVGGGLCWSHDHEKRLMAPFDCELRLIKSSHTGPLTMQMKIDALNAVLKIDANKAKYVGYLIEQVYTTMAMIRNMEQSVPLKSEKVYGRFSSVNSMSYSFVSTWLVAQEIFGQVAVRISFRELMAMERGSYLENHWRQQKYCPSEPEYMKMMVSRSCSLYRICIGLLQSQSDVDVDLTALGDNLGLIHRLQSDNTRLTVALYSGNVQCPDLVCGQLSLPLVHSYNADASHWAVKEIIEAPGHVSSEETLRAALVQMKETKSFEHTQRVILDLERSSIDILDHLDSDGHETTLLRSMLKLLVTMHRCPVFV